MSRHPIDLVKERLPNARLIGKDYMARCPSHDDLTPSLAFREAHDNRVLITCHAGCTFDEIITALGLEKSALFASQDNNASRIIVEEYDYRDEQGMLLYQVVRYSPKGFSQRKPDGSGWVYKLNGVRRVLYRLSKLLTADKSAPVFIVEGEKDADRLISLGLIATTNAGGAGKWRDDYSQYLRGRHAVIISDNDASGRKHAAKVARAIHGEAASIKVVELPGLAEKDDVSDWLDAGHDSNDLNAIVERTKEWIPVESEGNEQLTRGFYNSLDDLLHADIATSEEIIFGIARGQVGELVSVTNVGKTTLMLNSALSLASGQLFYPLINEISEPKKVLWLDFESRGDEIRKDLKLMLHGVSNTTLVRKNFVPVVDAFIGDEPLCLTWSKHLHYVLAKARAIRPDLIVIDTVSSAFYLSDENSNAEIRSKVMSVLYKLAREANAAVLFAHHEGKKNESGSGERAYSGRGASAFGGLSRAVFNLERDEKRGSGYVTLRCSKIKGKPFEPLLLKLNFDSRWFEHSAEEPAKEALSATEVADFVSRYSGTVRTADIISKFQSIASMKTIKRRIDNALSLGLIERMGQGKFRPKDQPIVDDPLTQKESGRINEVSW
jgi:5S rRNA maturation endonuclease (ribonuclease M5)